jgi:hypothetical protein
VGSRAAIASLVVLLVTSVSAQPGDLPAIRVDAPPALAAAAARARSFDLRALRDDLVMAGLDLPPGIQVTLVGNDDPRSGQVPPWVVGFASGTAHVVVFPDRVLPYPYDSLESVLRHEIAHLALSARAGGQPVPRWFHEGVAVSVDAGWDVSSQLQLLLAMRRNPGIENLRRLFTSGNQPDSALAYRLSAALVSDVRRRHGAAVPGRIAARVAAGSPFDLAFELETGERPDAAAGRAWAGYRRWSAWVSAVTSDAMPWTIILALAFVAFFARVRQRWRRRSRWEEDQDDWPSS